MKRIFRGKNKFPKSTVRRKSNNPEDAVDYQHAIEAYRQTMPPAGSSNDDDRGGGTGIVESNNNENRDKDKDNKRNDYVNMTDDAIPLAEHSPRRQTITPTHDRTNKNKPTSDNKKSADQLNSLKNTTSIKNNNNVTSASLSASQQQQYEPPSIQQSTEASSSHSFNDNQPQQQQQQPATTPYNYYYNNGFDPYYETEEPTMVDATYEEWYGDGYIGSPIKYIYPSGYQAMRPRGGPWKLSIFICLLFTWLSIFIVGHCSDRYDASYNANNNNNNNGNNNIYDYYNNNNDDKNDDFNRDMDNYDGGNDDDDEFYIETRWCGSRMLYFMWIMSMMITGLSASYCGIIGYIKVRDFAVANSRSQPPGMVGKVDYYVNISSSNNLNNAGGGLQYQVMPSSPTTSNISTSGSSSVATYQKSIYQADGTPQFWGGHIYRPTQAAVAVTNR